MKIFWILFFLTSLACSSMRNTEGELKEAGELSYRIKSSFGEITVKPVHKQWKGYPFLSYEARVEFLKSRALIELANVCGENFIKVNVRYETLDYPPSMVFTPVNPSGFTVHFTCKVKTKQ